MFGAVLLYPRRRSRRRIARHSGPVFADLWEGTFPDWNPYVFMGSPLLRWAIWSFTYPPQGLSYAIARHLLGNEFATMEVFAALHLSSALWPCGI